MSPSRRPARLTLGPLLFNWPAARRRDFYFRIADEAPLDTVCLGEVVCAKRAPFVAPHLAAIAERLRRAGKEVVWSTLALVMSARELEDLNEIASVEDALVEANDLGCARALRGRAHAIGPFVNVYNEDTLRFLAGRGAVRITLPVELPGAAIGVLTSSAASIGTEVEVQAFGRMPLALSARCYHARRYGLHKNNCRYVCERDPDGLPVATLDGRPFLAINGTQTLSHAIGNLSAEIDQLRGAGVGGFRLSPHAIDMVAVARAFRDRLDGLIDDDETYRRLAALAPFAAFANGFWHGSAGAALIRAGGLAE